ncbi:hypothetical protein [Pedobacter cryoconitis]|uniref:Uncharacterized protein n=1 Tax=Pedobacter cryoconitis TaxID=188932 RepID=A0A7X0IZQ9_9SPHI|nr:hypothetical protein [Pedobacter cryoconitis]MBB6498404.1 hypothetical protein [Pedobacter cryoconitis]
METFLEFLFTAFITVLAGFLILKYKPKTRRRARNIKLNRTKEVRLNPQRKSAAGNDFYRNYSGKFILLFLIGMTLFSSVFYLVNVGYVIIKW